ncbi:hypothetical protein BPLS_P0371 [Bathymodiolus platifrons methanotrophic gill symbiont]|uniref:hypothetical protein n=1 Tax=Bathymodiolus platifrons methanotrophic gill symbiont TaxID=113268 RepID=UPI000B421F6A|nr:hypothetical protein [Bathymodiolus platifrons methanotrophic gill symbiont]MCK5869778.1 hypothetical protein [Methyloprofundus sp.]TXK97050.1 hypothetical protein BMR10_06120 [Methylococcaceae bacterium CS4]TXK99377.1 hypothetical protein BMR11_06635 [Methylococcaceae bacterium CS5]TXL00744.1 hypothetical protein BMR02_04995 [Methylococcaceae bacterium HT1]TXL05032.1 hypothetical protein BMR07_10840 [Methylococcaceae bacterium CS1]TXL05473.1 hypothetical protein BMR09_10120 [Methylococcac
MKKLFAGLGLMLIATASFAKPYVCKGYIDGAQAGEAITVNASKTPVAEDKAYQRMLKAGTKVDYVQCK